MRTASVLILTLCLSMSGWAQPYWHAVFQTQDGFFTQSCSGGPALNTHMIAYLYLDLDHNGPDSTDLPPLCVWIPGMGCTPEQTRFNYRNFALEADGTINSPPFEGYAGEGAPPLPVYLRIFLGANSDSCYTSPVVSIPSDTSLQTIVIRREEWTCSVAEVRPFECLGNWGVVSWASGPPRTQCITVCPGGYVAIMASGLPNLFRPPVIKLSVGCETTCDPAWEIHFLAGARWSVYTDMNLWITHFYGHDAGCITVNWLTEIPCARLDTMTAVRAGAITELRWNTVWEHTLASFQLWNMGRHVLDLPADDNEGGAHYAVRGDTSTGFGSSGSYILVMVDTDSQEYAAAYVDHFGTVLTATPSAIQPSSFNLSSFPNPFNPTTTLAFSLPQTGQVKVVVYDLLGREVAVLAERVFEAGEQRLRFDGSALPSGLYFARLQSGPISVTQKLLLLK
jgi:hypothetical protein